MKYCTLCKTKYEDGVSFCPIDGEVLEGDPASIVDTVLDGQYQMEALLGKGGMGAVYSARHILLGDRVAIKVLPPEVRNNADWLRRFRREGQAARRFRHPNAVTVYDLRTAADGTIYMVMEYVEGHTLDAELKRRGKFTAADSYEILAPIMSVLDTAHEMGVVHRDLKPENIMVGNPSGNGAPVIKLLDLGIAKMREIAGVNSGGNTALTMAGQVLGTPYYMSPEQWGEIPRDENLEIDGRADIYSLGLVFYEMIVGRRCFAGNTLHELRREHVATKPVPLHEVVADIPRGFSDAIERATAKDRADRQATAGALANELKAGLGTAPKGATSSQIAQQFETVAIVDKLQTNSDVNAATIITIDASATASGVSSTETTARPRNADVQQIVPSKPDPQMSAATVAEAAPMESSVTIPQVNKPVSAPVNPSTVAPVTPQPKSKVGLIVGAVVVVVLVLGGLGALGVWYKTRTTSVTPTTNGGTGEVVSPPREISRYWLELDAKAAGQPSSQVAGLVPVASGQSFRMHFTFSENGYLYIVGPGPGNKPMAFLTAKPLRDTGVDTNQVIKNVGYSFPRGEGRIGLDKNPGTDSFTVIYSPTPLTSPAFLNAPVDQQALTEAQNQELKNFVSQHQQNPVVTELDESDRKAPYVRVKMAPNQAGNPIVFDIRIQHN